MANTTMKSSPASKPPALTFDEYPSIVRTSKVLSRGKQPHTKANKKHDQLVVKANKVLNDLERHSPSARPRSVTKASIARQEVPVNADFPMYTHVWEEEAAEVMEQLDARLLEHAERFRERSERRQAMEAKQALGRYIQYKLLVKDCKREWKKDMAKKTQKKGRKARMDYAYL